MAVLAVTAIVVAATGCDSEPAVGTELTWWDTADPAIEGPAFDELVARFQKANPDVKIRRQWVSFTEAQARFKAAAARQTGAPDILRSEVAWVAGLAEAGYLYNLDGSELLADVDDYFPTPMSSARLNGKTYGVPQVADTLALLYNKKIFRDSGLAGPPETWAQVRTAAGVIKAKTGKDGLFLTAGGYFLLPFIYGEGADLVDTDAKKITVNSSASVKGILTAQELVNSGAALRPPANESYKSMMTLFHSQQVAMIITGPWEVGALTRNPTFGGPGNLGVAPVPAGSARAGAPAGGHDYVLYSRMPPQKVAAAIAFVKFMNSAQSQAFLATRLGLLPTRKSAYRLDSVTANPVLAAFPPVLSTAIPRPWTLDSGLLFAPLDSMAGDVLVHGGNPKAALDAVADTYRTTVAKGFEVD